MPVIGEVCYEEGVEPYIVFSSTPNPSHPDAECTACVVKTMSPSGTIVTYTSPDPQLVKTTHFEMIGGVQFTITDWTFTFPAGLGGSKRHPWSAKFTGTAGVLAVHTTTHRVAPDIFP